MTWKSSSLSAVLVLGFVLTPLVGKAQHTNTPKREGQTSPFHGATIPKKHAAHPLSGSAVNLPANAVTNQGAPLVAGEVGKVPHRPLPSPSKSTHRPLDLLRQEAGRRGPQMAGRVEDRVGSVML